ncbi:hypothetical protein SAMN05444166_0720 [Singulisphaera sp. GP187]|uniref:hypothetical protein n=1 Tax=Singulisphaera sp. GP187 TaxID=1882752 RepID=UPI00092A46E2|nr:hypothetical protein [Singulisphaera sp. GP187]SIN76579.1 hypothetical protein SAMN05444166_0720 [Singulisphaera sp. GP187]
MRRVGSTHLVQRLGITLLILGLAHVPLPIVDIHVVRHTHGKGQVCPMHNHLLRWHASDASPERAVLHFHWAFLAGSPPVDATHGPAIHADAPAPFGLGVRDDVPEPSCTDPEQSLVAKPLLILLADLLPFADADRVRQAMCACSAPPSRNFGTTFPPRHSVASRLQRGVC